MWTDCTVELWRLPRVAGLCLLPSIFVNWWELIVKQSRNWLNHLFSKEDCVFPKLINKIQQRCLNKKSTLVDNEKRFKRACEQIVQLNYSLDALQQKYNKALFLVLYWWWSQDIYFTIVCCFISLFILMMISSKCPEIPISIKHEIKQHKTEK
jgi:hypothetical protein